MTVYNSRSVGDVNPLAESDAELRNLCLLHDVSVQI
jgi:hypothetical protein